MSESKYKQKQLKELNTALANLRALLWLAAHKAGGRIELDAALVRGFSPEKGRLDVEALPDNGGFVVVAAWNEPRQ